MTAGTLDVKIQDSSDNSTFADVSGGSFTQITTANGGTRGLSLNTQAMSRYIRAVGTLDGGGTAVYSVWMIGRKQYAD